MIQFNQVSVTYPRQRWFAAKPQALQSVSFNVQPQQTMGIIGPNGAGKTTTLRLLLGLLKPTHGSIQVGDWQVHSAQHKKQLGYLPERPYFYPQLTGVESLRYAAALYGMQPGKDLDRTIESRLDAVALLAHRHKRVREYSKGMQQRLGIAAAMLHQPSLLLLDEPMSGLDPGGRHQMNEFIKQFQQQGTTIIFCSHILADVQALCDEVVVLNHGKVICQGVLHDLLPKKQHGFEIVVEGAFDARVTGVAQQTHHSQNSYTLNVGDAAALEKTLAEIRQVPAATVVQINTVQPSLESNFDRLLQGECVE